MFWCRSALSKNRNNTILKSKFLQLKYQITVSFQLFNIAHIICYLYIQSSWKECVILNLTWSKWKKCQHNTSLCWRVIILNIKLSWISLGNIYLDYPIINEDQRFNLNGYNLIQVDNSNNFKRKLSPFLF